DINGSYEVVLSDIMQVLKSVCDANCGACVEKGARSNMLLAYPS
ncbi:hypothetical protein Tco_1397104, partial [Tanacetum coccineum]